MYDLPNKNKISILIFLLFFLCGLNLFAQENEEDIIMQKSDIWFALTGDGALFSSDGFAYGGGISFGYGSGSCIGLKVSYFFGTEGIDTIELNMLLRFYLTGIRASTGPFLQINAGPSLYNKTEEVAIPSSLGMFSAGLSFGWRFLLNDFLYIEPYIRGGYPYLAGAGFSIGIKRKP